MSRTSQSIKNIIAGVGSQILLAVITFLTTRLIKFNLGFEYLGLNGVFNNIVNILCLTELGIGAAITFALYKPLSEKNLELVAGIMHFYKVAYRTVSAVIFILGLATLPFLPFFIKTTLPMNYVRGVFMLFVINTSFSYLLSYKRNIIFADQKNYIITIYTLVFSALMRIMQLVGFLLTNSYIVYLCVNILCTMMLNIAISIKADKLYPFLRERSPAKLLLDTKQMLWTKIKALFFHYVGGFLVMGTDNILISYFCGVSIVGIYGSYMLIISTIEKLVSNIYDGINSSVGNFLVEKKADDKYALFEKIEFANSVIVIFVSVCFAVLLNPFVRLWLGDDSVLPRYVIYLLVLSKFIAFVEKPISSVKDAAGLFEQDRYAPLVESAINLTVSCVLAHFIGIAGIIIGTIVSSIAVPSWVKPVVVFRNLFKCSPIKFFFRIIRNLIYVIIITFIIELVLAHIFIYNNLITLIVFFSITIFVTIIAIIFLFMRDKNFIFFKELVWKFVFRK